MMVATVIGRNSLGAAADANLETNVVTAVLNSDDGHLHHNQNIV